MTSKVRHEHIAPQFRELFDDGFRERPAHRFSVLVVREAEQEGLLCPRSKSAAAPAAR
jgi:hypothetical protein